MSRAAAIAARKPFRQGEFLADLRRRVAIPSTSQEPERAAALRGYLADEMVPSLAPLGFTTRILDNPRARRCWWPNASRTGVLTVLLRPRRRLRGLDDRWREGCRPGRWSRATHLRPRHRRQQGPAHDQPRGARRGAGERGRPTRLQREVPDRDRRGDRLAGLARDVHAHTATARRRRADRLRRTAAGARPADDVSRRARRRSNFDLIVDCARAAITPAIGAGSRQPGDPSWRMRSPASSVRAARSLEVRMAAAECRNSVRSALADVEVDGGRRRPDGSTDIGASRGYAGRAGVWLVQLRGAGLHDRQAREPGQRDPAGSARGHCQIRFVVGVDVGEHLPALRRHLDAHGFPVEIARRRTRIFRAAAPRSRRSLGRAGPPRRSKHHRQGAGDPAQSRRLVAERQCSPTCSACRRSGCRIPMPGARSTRPTSTCSRRSRARGLAADGGTLLGPRRAGSPPIAPWTPS